MLLAGTSALREAWAARRAIPGFVAYNLETAQGIVAGAETASLPIFLQAGSSAFRHAGLPPLAQLALLEASLSTAQVGVHLDHCTSPDEITACLALGYTSVMVDGSHLPFDQNVALTIAVVNEAHAAGAWVEAKLGALAGDEDVSTAAAAGAMTDPGQAGEFAAATGVDALAVAVGNVHGFTPSEPRIDLDRLAAINERTGIPLVLHGASGLSPSVLVGCLERGVAKVNVNAELRRAFLGAVAESLPEAQAGDDLARVLATGRRAVAAAVARITETLARSS